MQTMANVKTVNIEIVKGAIAAKIDSAAFTSWIAPLQFNIVDNTLVLGAQNQFSVDFINSVYANLIKEVVSQFNLNVKIVVCNGNAGHNLQIANDNNTQVYTPVQTVKNTSVAFDSFVCCDENVFVLSACKKIAAGIVSFSPLFIYGPAGCGKTLLTDCIASCTSKRVVKMTGTQFVSDFTRSLKDRNIFAFKDFCRNCDIFILDDVQALSGKQASTDEFIQLLLDLRGAGKNVILTANAAPNNLTGFDRRIQSLLASGLVADVTAPNRYVKNIMLQRAGVTSGVAETLSGRIADNGHLICGVATKIQAYNELMGTCVDIDIAQRLLSDVLSKTKTPAVIVREMCEKLAVSYDAVCGSGRNRSLVLARQIMMVVLKNVTGLSLVEIGNFVGGRDHATVLYAIKQIEKLQQSDLVLSAQIQQLVKEYK